MSSHSGSGNGPGQDADLEDMLVELDLLVTRTAALRRNGGVGRMNRGKRWKS